MNFTKTNYAEQAESKTNCSEQPEFDFRLNNYLPDFT